jgi:hypothetical protein
MDSVLRCPPLFQGFKAFSELKSLAEAAQINLGLDYAWLDDVTYQDWQNYHDLLKSKIFLVTLIV